MIKVKTTFLLVTRRMIEDILVHMTHYGWQVKGYDSWGSLVRYRLHNKVYP